MKKLMSPAAHQPTFAPAEHPSFQHSVESFPSSKMSSSKSALQTEITSLKATLAERDAQIATLTAAAAAVPAVKRAKKERAPADPSKPRMLSPYIVFCQAERAKAGADAKLKAADLGEMWKLLTPEARATYKPVPAAVKEPKPEKQKRVKKSDEAAAEGGATPKAKKERKQKDPDAPKKPLTGFMLFSQQQRAAHTGEGGLTAKVLGERWALLSDEAKAGYKSS